MKKVNNIEFKKAMSNFATGVTIVSINHKNNFIGKTVSSFSSLSLKPPLVLFSLDKKASSLKLFLNSKYIGINILQKNQKNLSIFYSIKEKKNNNNNFFLSDKKVPLLKEGLVNLECKLSKKHMAGDHIIFICEIISTKILKSKKPMIYFKNKYL